MTAIQQHRLFYKVLSLFSSVRIYNIIVIAIAQLLTSGFIMGRNLPIKHVLLDWRLWFLILASAAAIAGGYIINNFYDREKDLINRPQKTLLENQVKRSTLWTVYFTLNFISFGLGLLVSWRAGLFYATYIFILWFYSHKLKKMTLIGNIMGALIAILPFFVIFIYYKNFSEVIFVHGFFLFLILLLREFIKDLENIRGDVAQNYMTLPAVHGEYAGKLAYTITTIATLAPVSLLLWKYSIGKMDYYFVFCLTCLIIAIPLLWSSRSRRHYLTIHNLLKAILIIGVASIVLIEWDSIISRLF